MFTSIEITLAATQKNLSSGLLNNTGADQPVHPRSLISTFVIRFFGILTSVDSDEPVQPSLQLRNYKWCLVRGLRVIEYSSDQQRHWHMRSLVWAFACRTYHIVENLMMWLNHCDCLCWSVCPLHYLLVNSLTESINIYWVTSFIHK